VSAFQKNLEKYSGTSHAITCANGTDALQIALMALGLEPGDEIITTPFTFIATVEAIAILGLKPVFVDACPRCFNIDTSQIEKNITGKNQGNPSSSSLRTVLQYGFDNGNCHKV
jgi:UDP-2-acetamido-2-deoxy-ribo-hexuluronate aminotransferase